MVGGLEITSSSNSSKFSKGGDWAELTESEVTKKPPSQRNQPSDCPSAPHFTVLKVALADSL